MKQANVKQLCQQLQTVSRKLNLAQADWQLLRLGNAWVFKNPKDELIARIHVQNNDRQLLNQQLKLYTRLAEANYPLVKPLLEEMISLKNNLLVSFWPLGQNNLRDLNSQNFIELLKNCHQITPLKGLAVWESDMPKAKRYRQLRQAQNAGADTGMLKHLKTLFERSQANLDNYCRNKSFPQVIIHGDLYHGNIIKLNNKLLLCDLDYLSLGPKERDLATVQVDCRRYLKTNFWPKIIENYPFGYDAKLLQLLVEAQEIGDCIYTIALHDINPETRQEIKRRLKHWHQPSFKWLPF